MERTHRSRRFGSWDAGGILHTVFGLALPFILNTLSAAASLPPLDRANWVWSRETETRCHLRKVFTLDTRPTNATILITADNGYELYVNGSLVGSDVGAASDIWQSVERYDITSRLANGRNIIGIHGLDLGGVRGVIAAARLELNDRPPLELVTDQSWRVAPNGQAVNYSHPEFIEGPEWHDAKVIGSMGLAPWGNVAWSQAGENSRAQATRSRVVVATPGPDFPWPERVAFVGDDCSVYVPLRGDAWGVAFRVGDWSRAYTEFDLPCPSKIGRKLYILEPGLNATPRVLYDAGSGAIGSPSATFDGNALLVAMAREGEQFFHIYRVPAASGEPQRLTDGPFHDIDPAELPDGRIVFTSTRIGTFEEYHQPPSRALFRMNADGSDIHLITATPIFDNEPKVMANGRLAFIRTDNFFDRGKVETHLHSIRPDGTDGLTEFGANVGPDYGSRLRAFGYGSPAPLPNGGLAYISNRGNFMGASGSPEREQHPLPSSLGDLAPLPDGRLLCTVLRPDGNQMSSDVLGVIDPRHNRIVSIFESSIGSIHSPVFLGARERPPVIPDYVDRSLSDQPGATGFLFCQDARFTTKTKADWERIRAIRVLGAVPLTTRSSHSHIVHVGHETVELGTVPLAPDGSFSIEVPADMPLALQAVDAEGRSELNEMSWLYVRPGERRSCIGCHQPREAAPAFTSQPADALRAPPVKVLGQGAPHRFRGNNPGVTGMMDLQFERFRECASLNRNTLRTPPNASRCDEIAALVQHLRGADQGQRISAAQRLALLRERRAAPALEGALKDSGREARLAAALALAACGTRDSIPPLVAACDDQDPVVAQAAQVALENLTGHTEPSNRSANWNNWLASNPWPVIETALVQTLTTVRPPKRSAIVALGHIGGEPARAALREFVRTEAANNPYPAFENDNRTDSFTFAAESRLNPRTLQEAVRALGQLRDTNALPLLRELLAKNIDPRTGNLFLVEAIIESLGRIGSPEAETTLLETFAALKDYWHYVGWYSDHPALYACHSSPVHARIIEALDALGSTCAAAIVPQLIRSVPTDPDRGLFLQNDDYETLVGRLIRRSGRGPEVVETCLALLGDPAGKPAKDITVALSTTHPAWGGHPGPQNRAAQILSLTCRDTATEPRVRAAFGRFRALPEEPISRTLGNPTWTPLRHWTLFYLARALGNLADGASVDTLAAVLSDDLNEARHGRPDPSQPEIHLLHLDYTPCWRAASAWALGEIGDRRARPALLGAVRNLANATDVRHAAAQALGITAAPSDLAELSTLAAGYPEVSVRKALQEACARIGGTDDAPVEVEKRQEPKLNPAALRLAIEDLIATHANKYPKGTEYLRQLAELERALSTGQAKETVRAQFLALSREALLANPLLDFDRLLVLKRRTTAPARKAMGGSLGVGDLNAHTSDTIPRHGQFRDELAVLSNLRGEPEFTTAFAPTNHETIIDPTLHFDANQILFAMNGAEEKNWRLWEIKLDDSVPRQITPDDGTDIGHFDPCHLPDGRIIFASTASYQGLPCEFGSKAMTCLYLLDPRTQQARQLTFEQDSDWCPTLLPNGRVLYLRWEYTDQSHANSRILFHMNPDGTDQREFRGSGSWFPGSFFYARAIPGETHQVIGVAGGHHGTPRSGRLLILDPSRGRRDAEGIVQEIPGRGKPVEPIVRDRLVDGVWPQFLMPAPLSAKYHLVSAKLSPNSLWGVYLVDVFDNITLVKELEDAALLWPTPVRQRKRPPVIQDRVRPDTNESTVFVADVHAGPGLQGIPRGTVKKLRLIEYYFAKRGMGGLYGTLGADGPWDVKRILGTVPIEEDGSAYFTMPANTPVSVQPLDERGQALQLERSWFVGMPGEHVSCIGCHESQDAAALSRNTKAMRRPPSKIDDWFGPARGFSFVREVQPVLDRHCASCHDGSSGGATPGLKGGEMLKDWKTQLSGHWGGGGKFTTSYWELQRFVRRPGIEGDRRMFTPMDYHFSTTELGQLLRKGHHGVELDTESHERLAAWADLNAPFYGTWGEIPQFTGGYGSLQCAQLSNATVRATELRKRYVPMGPFPDYEAIPAPAAYDPTPVKPTKLTKDENRMATVAGWPFDAAQAVAMQTGTAARKITRRIRLPGGATMEFVLVPGGRFVMGATNGHPDELPCSVVEVNPFWMARFETSNRQFKEFDPGHESRTEDRHGYQFGAVGYDQDQPEQPVVRVSWEEAVEFCRWLSRQTRMRFTLPTEAQWEWACRAGSASPFSFGDSKADFSPYANLGDRRLRDFAADTSLDHYSAQRPMANPNRYDDWLPRDDRFNDGGFVTEPVGRYKPNRWGLHDLHGNAAEWTLSAYRPYPWRSDDGRNAVENAPRDTERVARGGSWRDRPFHATTTYRLPYRQYQRVYNVGFRVVREGEWNDGNAVATTAQVSDERNVQQGDL